MAETIKTSIRKNRIGIDNTNPTSVLHIGTGTSETNLFKSDSIDMTLTQAELTGLIQILDPSYIQPTGANYNITTQSGGTLITQAGEELLTN